MTLNDPWVDEDPVSNTGSAEEDGSCPFPFGACSDSHVRDACAGLLREAGLRLTRQRLMLGCLLFAKGGRHLTAEKLHAEAAEANIHMSLATVYNTLNQFTDAGLLRQIGIDGSKSFFDTNPTAHHHFFVGNEERLFDIPEPGVLIEHMPDPLPGYELSRVDVIIHLRRKSDVTRDPAS